MSQTKFKSEVSYGVLRAIAKALFIRQLLTETEYHEINCKLIASYRPIIDTLKSR